MKGKLILLISAVCMDLHNCALIDKRCQKCPDTDYSGLEKGPTSGTRAPFAVMSEFTLDRHDKILFYKI